MFLDPDPKRQKQGMSGFFSSQTPIESPRDHRRSVRREPLHERSPSQNNRQNPGRSLDKSTVRLVKQSPSPSAQNSSESDDNSSPEKENRDQEHFLTRLPSSEDLKLASAVIPGFAASGQDINVSDIPTSTNEAQTTGLTTGNAWLSATITHAVPKAVWHRRSGSTGNYSNSSTLREGESSIHDIAKSEGRQSRLSEGTTLRGTPTPYEQEIRERIEAEDTTRQGSLHALQTLQEASPERSTVRAIPPSVKSNSSGHQLSSEPSQSSLTRPRNSSSASDPESKPPLPRRSSRRTLSASSLPAPLHIRKVSGPSAPRNQQSHESIAQSEATLSPSSSPNFLTYSDPSRPRSRSHPLHASASIESIESRLQYPSLVRPHTGRSLATSSSWASLEPSSSTDTLPPLQVPKKRVRHKPAHLNLGAAANSSSSSRGRMDSENIDTLPYPRQQFSSHLSTIASESDNQSRSTSQQLSHFSLGSGVLTGDDSSSIPFSGTWPRRRRESAPIVSIASESSQPVPRASSEEEPGDMTLGIYRDESAKPQPLFRPSGDSARGSSRGRKYDGPLPPIPPIPKSRDSDENFDTVSELQSPPLREKRSGYSLRARSNSTPSRSHSHSRHLSQMSYSESERWSHGSSIFPTWAKHFYGQGATLLSASKVTLSTPSTPRAQNGARHGRNDSQRTERSITSRLGTGYSEIESGSPTSSHFLPSIFRPRTRGRANTEGNNRSSKLRKSKKSRPSGEGGRPDSMAIFNDPLPQSRNGEMLASGQPKYGELKDSSDRPLRPLPRKYSKQKHWDDMEFPRPMTKDRLSDFGMHASDPHLAPTKRTSHRLSAWRAPSFVESLDTLVRSRCNRQILLFALGFVCPLCWMLAAVLPIPKRPISANDLEKSLAGSEDDVQAAMMKHEAGDAERRWREEKAYFKARWWRLLNRIMSVIGVLVIGAVIALAIVATTR